MKTDTATRKGRIIGIQVEHKSDTVSDTSYLGEYTDQPGPADRTVDRAVRGDCGRGEYRFFVASRSGDETGNQASVEQDYQRMEALNRGEWGYIGIIATAEIVLPGSNVIQRISSGGLWGVESDAGDDYHKQVASEELGQLRTELTTIGFGRRAIDAAMRNCETVTR